jgi:hypothetical protein
MHFPIFRWTLRGYPLEFLIFFGRGGKGTGWFSGVDQVIYCHILSTFAKFDYFVNLGDSSRMFAELLADFDNFDTFGSQTYPT